MKETILIFAGLAGIIILMVIIVRIGRSGRFQAAVEEALKAMHK